MKILLVGPTAAGKTTLTNALAGRTGKARKTQMIEFVGQCLDTPGEYLEIPRLYRHLFVSAQQADVVLMVIAADQCQIQLPRGLAHGFIRPVIGVISKIDRTEGSPRSAGSILTQLGVKEPYYAISAHTGEGLDKLKAAIGDLESKITKPRG